jgi:hypothetical protein
VADHLTQTSKSEGSNPAPKRVFVSSDLSLNNLFSTVGVIDPKSHNKALGQKDGRARDVLAEDSLSEKPFFSEVIQVPVL